MSYHNSENISLRGTLWQVHIDCIFITSKAMSSDVTVAYERHNTIPLLKIRKDNRAIEHSTTVFSLELLYAYGSFKGVMFQLM